MNFGKMRSLYVRVRACMCMRAHAPSRGGGCACPYMHARVCVCQCSLRRPANLILESISGSVSQCPLDMYYVCVCISRLMWEMSSQYPQQ